MHPVQRPLTLTSPLDQGLVQGANESQSNDARCDANEVEHLRIWVLVRGRDKAPEILARRALSGTDEHQRISARVDFESVGRRFESCRGYFKKPVTVRVLGELAFPGTPSECQC